MNVTMAYHFDEMNGSPDISYEQGRIVAPGIVMIVHSMGESFIEVKFYSYEKEETDSNGSTMVHVDSDRSDLFVFELKTHKHELLDLIKEGTDITNWIRKVVTTTYEGN